MEVLKYMDDNWASLNDTAVKFKIPDPSIIRTWRKAVETEGVEALLPKKKGRPPMKKARKTDEPNNQTKESLIQEVERLRMENAYLKKLNALVQEQEKLQENTKCK
ncbi:helix-turn-helix domain-containing protein [Bacillus sp. JJ1562]|uniref:helix-turn-helix domain-containing protein n=1 Tax=Bacillus sp. JJ1562 TaxID=3122960 RepID=UPI003002DFA3